MGQHRFTRILEEKGTRLPHYTGGSSSGHGACARSPKHNHSRSRLSRLGINQSHAVARARGSTGRPPGFCQVGHAPSERCERFSSSSHRRHMTYRASWQRGRTSQRRATEDDSFVWSKHTVVEPPIVKDEDSTGGSVTNDLDCDQRVLALRDQGRSFLDIARILDLDDPRGAQAAFVKVLQQRPRAEQAWLRSCEMARLDALASRMRGRDDLSVEEIIRHLRGLKHQRETLFVG